MHWPRVKGRLCKRPGGAGGVKAACTAGALGLAVFGFAQDAPSALEFSNVPFGALAVVLGDALALVLGDALEALA